MRRSKTEGPGKANKVKSYHVVPDTRSSNAGERASRAGSLVFSTVIFVVSLAIVLAIGWVIQQQVGLLTLVIALVVAFLAVSSIHIAPQWERVVVLRLGKFNRVSGPGLFFTIPLFEHNTIHVDQRVRVTSFNAEETLTADLVPLNVDAVLFWMVWDAKAAATEVSDFTMAVEMAAQTSLRDAIGRAGVAEVAIRREQLDRELKKVLEEKVSPWGITIMSVEVRDILVPKELQDTMSLEAQAEQRKKARIILMEAEQDIFEMMAELEKTNDNTDYALRLRAMHLLYESVKDTGGTVVVPSSFSEGFGDIFPEGMGK